MGNIWTRLLGKESTRQTLERIQNQLDQIDEYKRSTQSSERKVVGHLFFAFIVIYLAAALLTYLCFFYHPDWQGLWLQTQLLAPFLIAPVIFYYARSGVIWYYHQKIRSNEMKREKLKQEKKDILERVMETETYKVAKELLDKFGNDHTYSLGQIALRSKVGSPISSERSVTTTPSTVSLSQKSGSEVRRRVASGSRLDASQSEPRKLLSSSPMLSMSSSALANSPHAMNASPNGGAGHPLVTPSPRLRPPHLSRSSAAPAFPALATPVMPRGPPGPPMPRPILPRERGYMDRLIEYLVGEGPSSRYALICRRCQSHNGMALREEFEYVAFRCCYCFFWNPARKQRPSAPRLELQATQDSQPRPPRLSVPQIRLPSSSSSSAAAGETSDEDKGKAGGSPAREPSEDEPAEAAAPEEAPSAAKEESEQQPQEEIH